ncbi:Ankyrin repeat domain-containing protein 26 [Apodemus speciosus]|uniref:Ankyrin repeat domain-containing protein 26 n=1 Tax=Apodemus speciosus TaxID=105296 RepID=A0ABQ0EVZ7_APOSI
MEKNMDLVEKLKQVNLFLQAQAASQENLEQLRENSNASVRSQMELRIKDLESQLYKMKAQEDFDKIELEKYKQLYQEEFRVRKSLSSKLNNDVLITHSGMAAMIPCIHGSLLDSRDSGTSEKLEEASTKLLLEEQQNRALLSTLSTRPVVECPCVGSLHKSMVFNRTLIPRENTVVPTSGLPPSSKRVEIYLTKMHQELEKSINRELKEEPLAQGWHHHSERALPHQSVIKKTPGQAVVAHACNPSTLGGRATAELESEFCRVSPLGSATKPTQDLLSEASQEYIDILKKKYMIC